MKLNSRASFLLPIILGKVDIASNEFTEALREHRFTLVRVCLCIRASEYTRLDRIAKGTMEGNMSNCQRANSQAALQHMFQELIPFHLSLCQASYSHQVIGMPIQHTHLLLLLMLSDNPLESR